MAAHGGTPVWFSFCLWEGYLIWVLSATAGRCNQACGNVLPTVGQVALRSSRGTGEFVVEVLRSFGACVSQLATATRTNKKPFRQLRSCILDCRFIRLAGVWTYLKSTLVKAACCEQHPSLGGDDDALVIVDGPDRPRARPAKGAGRLSPWPSVDVFDAAGTKYGELKFGVASNTLSAHCTWIDPSTEECCHGLCRLDRTCNRNDRFPDRGRPLGFLIAWILRAAQHPTRDSHFHDRLGDTISRDERVAARDWAVGRPEFAFFLERERDCRPGEPEEPMGTPS
jgi:hypothetical protein